VLPIADLLQYSRGARDQDNRLRYLQPQYPHAERKHGHVPSCYDSPRPQLSYSSSPKAESKRRSLCETIRDGVADVVGPIHHVRGHICRYSRGARLHEVVQEVFVAVLVAGLRYIVLGHDIVVCMIPPPRELFPLLGDSSFFLALGTVSLARVHVGWKH
jgi:hypothetical protein